jgi:predicted amidohydrolase YtcJ
MPASSLAPDLILVNASIHTMDPRCPEAGGIATLGNRIVAIGSSQEILGLARSSTRIIDAQGGLVLPGFNDAHVHFLSGGFSLANVDLREAKSLDEMARRLGQYAGTRRKGDWILGGDWDHELWPGSPLPTKAAIDSLVPDNPVFVRRLDEHMALANSLALTLAGITCATEDPPGGVIVRAPASGEPTGLLKDAAMALVYRVIPAKSFAQRHAAALAATRHAAQWGVTSLTDMSADEDLGLYQLMVERGELQTRIYAARSLLSWEKLAGIGIRAPFGHPLLRIGCLKAFADGSLGSSTALFFEPYDDDLNNRGLLFEHMLPEGIMLQRLTAADQAGLQILIHAIGDEANARVLDLYQQLAATNGPRDRRCRIEHAQHLRPSEIPRFRELKVTASMQPYHLADDGRWCEKRIGANRSRGTYAFGSLLDAGATLAFGSDWPVAPLNPLAGIKAAVTRCTLDGRHPDGWIPQEKITVDEAVRAWTVGSAHAEFAESYKGTLVAGNLADLVMLDQDIYRMNPLEIDRVRVVLTVVDGQVVYEVL